jgi:hypothetical protein
MSDPQPCHKQFQIVKPFDGVAAKFYNHYLLSLHHEAPGNCNKKDYVNCRGKHSMPLK